MKQTMKKRLLAMLLCGATALSLTACGNSDTCLLYTSRCV